MQSRRAEHLSIEASAIPQRLPSPLRRIGRHAARFSIFLVVSVSLAGEPSMAQLSTGTPWAAEPSVRIIAEDYQFRNGDVVFNGTLHLPAEGSAMGAAVVTHTASKPIGDTPLYRHLTQLLPPLEIAVLTYDRRGSGKSGGSLARSDYAQLADDAIAAVRSLKADRRFDAGRIGIWGLSQGGWLSLLAAARSPDVRFVVSISAPVVTPDVQMMFRSENSLRINGYSDADIAQMRATRKAIDDYMRGSGDRETAQKLVDVARTKPWFDQLYLGATVGDRATSRWRKEIEYDPLPTLDDVRVPALILFGANDPVVPVETSAERVKARLQPNMTMRIIAGTDHHMSTSMSPIDQMDAAKTRDVEANSLEYFSNLAGWLMAQGIARLPAQLSPVHPTTPTGARAKRK